MLKFRASRPPAPAVAEVKSFKRAVRAKLQKRHLLCCSTMLAIFFAVVLLVMGREAFQPAILLYVGLMWLLTFIPLCLEHTSAINDESLQRGLPFFSFIVIWTLVAMTGGWDSAFVGAFTASVFFPFSAPTISINIVPIAFAHAVGYSCLYVFRLVGNPFPQFLVPMPHFVMTLQYIVMMVAIMMRIDSIIRLAASAVADEVTANESKSRFIAIASHEMRTPLNSILGWSELLQQSETLDPDDRQIVETIRACGKNLLAIINNILDYSKYEKGLCNLEKIPFNLAEVMNDAFESARILVKRGVRYNLHSNLLEFGRLLGDPFRLNQILANIISNAAKFTEKGEINVNSFATKQPDGRVQVAFSVCDTGIGMKPESVQRIWEPFFQADDSITRQFGGTGLGLPITKQLVENMGGKVDISSRLGVGTTFSWTLVFEEAPPEAHDEHYQHELEELASPLSLSVLVVEDNKFNQKLLSRVLSNDRCEVTIAENGREALQAAEAADFDLIMMDIQMPLMDGITATQELCRRGISAPIVGITANADDQTRAEATRAGMVELLTKPVTLRTICNMTHRFRMRKAVRNRETAP